MHSANIDSPPRYVQKTQEGWQEVLIAAAESAGLTSSDLNVDTTLPPHSDPIAAQLTSRFRRVLSPLPTASSTLLGLSSARFKGLPPGSTLEISPAAFKIARKIGELVHDAAGAGGGSAGSALVVDYGAENAFGDSFRVSVAYLYGV